MESSRPEFAKFQFEWVTRRKRDEDGYSCERHFLIDVSTSRVWGYVESPTSRELAFEAAPCHSGQRYYTEIEPAKAFLQESAMVRDREERLEMEKFLNPIEQESQKVPE